MSQLQPHTANTAAKTLHEITFFSHGDSNTARHQLSTQFTDLPTEAQVNSHSNLYTENAVNFHISLH